MNIRLTDEINFAFNADIENQSDLENAFVDAKIDYASIFISDPEQIKSKIQEWQLQINNKVAKDPGSLLSQISKYKQMLNISLHLHVFIPTSGTWEYVKIHTYKECLSLKRKGEFFDEQLGSLTRFITQ